MTIPGARAAIWDMDGTLIDSADYHWLAWRDVMQKEGKPITYDEFAATFGQRNDTILRGYFGPDISLHDIERISTEKETRYRTHVRTQGIHLLPGIYHWLIQLHADGWQQAVASAAPRQNIATILDVLDIGSFFKAIVSAEDVQHGKPDPSVFLTAAERLNVAPSRCVVIEDSPAGIEGAHRAGMRAIGVQTTHAHIQADCVVKTLDELPAHGFEQLVDPG